jgi:pimeloyl-ACP methyl ester carboxylesterase
MDDELSLLAENAAEAGLPFAGPPPVERRWVAGRDGYRVSGLVWGDGEPEVVLLHGGAQNAHTWDTVALALGRPLVAIDLPGHGRSDWRDDHDYDPRSMALDVALAVEAWAPRARAVVGMSLGGMTAIVLGARRPDLVRRLGIVDVTPGTDHAKAEPIVAFIMGPEHFDSFDAILARTIEHNPTRSHASLRRGVLHNARALPDGRWTWRYDPARAWKMAAPGEAVGPDFTPMWDEVSALSMPVWLWRGARSTVVGDEDVEELVRRCPQARVLEVPDAGHSIQGDRPLVLAASIAELLDA